MASGRPTWICSQIGAREHYAVPRALHKDARLGSLYTDFWAGPATRRIEKLKFGNRNGAATRTLRALAARYQPELEKAEIVSWNFRTLWWERILRSKKSGVRSQKSEVRNQYHGFIEVGSRFAIRVREALKRRSDLKPDSIFFAYDTGALEALEWCRERGVKCILNQMDPNRVEVELVRAEEKRWPGWSPGTVVVPEEYFTRREREWALADRVVVNSEFSRQALLRQGVPAEKLAVIPLCYEANAETLKSETGNRKPGQPLRVLFLGQVILRKGIQYLIEAAKMLEKESIRFEIVGAVGISQTAVASAPQNMIFHGRSTRDKVDDWYGRADVFVLPTLSDGFAITQLEAMAHGLPVIATPCCGEVIGDGVDGFVVPARDAEALARTFRRYLAEPDLLRCQSAAALLKAGQFTMDRLAENLMKLEVALEDDK
jgi:glycosyltransferase involved in cell wall biosynthesis